MTRAQPRAKHAAAQPEQRREWTRTRIFTRHARDAERETAARFFQPHLETLGAAAALKRFVNHFAREMKERGRELAVAQPPRLHSGP